MDTTKVVPFTDETQDAIVSEYVSQGFRLVEIRRLVDGDFLVFEKDFPTLEERLKALETALLDLLFREVN